MRLARDRAGGCTPGEPLSCLRQERVRGRTGQAAFLPAARAGAWPHGTGRFLAYGKSGKHHTAARRKHAGVYGRPILLARLAAGRSCLFLGLAAGEASPAPPGRGLRPLPTPLRGALPPRPPNGGKCPPSPPLKGRGPLLRGKGKTRAFDREKMTHRSARLAAGRSCLFLGLVAAPWPPKGGGVPPYPPLTGRVAPAGRAALLPAARAESLMLQLGGNTRTRAEDLHRPSVSERPKARNKVLCQAFFQESGGRLAGGGAGGVGEGGQLTGGVVHSPAEILRPLAVQLQNHRVSGEGFGAVVLADSLDFPV